MTRLRSRSKPARPYIWRLIILILLTVPSTLPEFQCRVRPLMTACWSLRMPTAKERRPAWSSASTAASQVSRSRLPVRAVIISAKCGHVPGKRVDVRAAGADDLELGLFVGLAVVGAGQQPAGDLAGLRDCPVRAGRGGSLPERPDVAADGLLAAGPAALSQFGVQRGSVGDAFVPPLVQVRRELIQLRFPAGRLAQQLLSAADAR